MKNYLSLFILFLSINCFAQFEYNPIDFDSNNSDYNSFSYQSKIYNIDRDNILREIDEFSGEISQYSVHTGFPIRGNTKHYQVDSFLVILNGERSTLEHSGALVFNMNSKEQKFYSWVEYLKEFAGSASSEEGPFGTIHYYPDPISISLSSQLISVGAENLYVFRQSYVDSMPILLKLNPVSGFEMLELTELGTVLAPEERVRSFASSESVMVVHTTSDRIIFWEIDNTANMTIVPYNLGETPYFYEAKEHKFPFSTTSNVQGIIDTTGTLRNFSTEFNLPNSSVGNRIFVGDSLCLSYQTDNNVIIIDTTENIIVVKDISNLGIPGNVYGVARHSDHKSLLLKMLIWPATEYQPSTYKLQTDGSVNAIRTTPLENIRDHYQDYGFVNKNNELFLLGINTYTVNKGDIFKQFFLEKGVLTSVPNGSSSVHKYFLGEDKHGNVYGEVSVSYPFSQNHLNRSYFLKVDAKTYEYSIVEKAEFDSVLYNLGAIVDGGSYTIDNGNLRFTANFSNEISDFMLWEDSLQKVLTLNERVFTTSNNAIYEFNLEFGTFRKIQSFSTNYSLYGSSYDMMGNIYITSFPPNIGAKLHKMAFDDSVFIDVAPSSGQIIGRGRYMHNWVGDIFIERTYHNFDSIVPENNLLYYFNGFEWNNDNSLHENLPYDGWSYKLRTSPYSTRILLERTQGRYIDVNCPTRDLSEIEPVYYLRDSLLPAEVSVNSDIKSAIWSNSFTGLTNEIHKPGQHWVKVLFENNCSTVKEFEVQMLPTQVNENDDIIYDFNHNSFPLIIDSEENVDVIIYDLKGANVKELVNYQNNWHPEERFKQSIMVYAVYSDSKKIKSGRILFY